MAHTYSYLYDLPTTGLRFFHHVRTLGPARHGADTVCQGDPGRGGLLKQIRARHQALFKT